MKFETSIKLNQWVKKHRQNCVSHTPIGEQFVYEFIPTGIVEFQTVKCMLCKEEFTDCVD